MHAAGTKSVATARTSRALINPVRIGQHVKFVSGVLSGLAGVVVRHEDSQAYVIGIPDADSRVLVRVERQRFRCQNAPG